MMKNKIKWKKLLAKYIDHVGIYEGVDFVPKNYIGRHSESFTNEEIEALWEVIGWDVEKQDYIKR